MTTPRQQLTVGFVGLGNMGWPMARNLYAAGFPLVVRDSAQPAQERFAAEHPGVTAATSPGSFAAAGTDAPAIALTEERWTKALGRAGAAADHSKALQAWWDDRLNRG